MKFEEIIKPEEEIKYPVLKKDPDDGMVVLFVYPDAGVCVDSGLCDYHEVGVFHKSIDEGRFSIVVQGTLTF